MRKIIGANLFLIVAVVSVAVGQPQPNCDGTLVAPKDKCNDGTVPTGYFESLSCQGDLPGVDACLHAIAFGQDHFYCTSPISNGENPPMYTTYCVDDTSVNPVDCYVTKECAGILRTRPNGSQYTECVQNGSPVAVKKYVKKALTSANNQCVATKELPFK